MPKNAHTTEHVDVILNLWKHLIHQSSITEHEGYITVSTLKTKTYQTGINIKLMTHVHNLNHKEINRLIRLTDTEDLSKK